MTEPISLIVGLGNPGQQYHDTRHNAGFWFTEKLCHQQHAQLRLESKFQGQIAEFSFEQRTIRVLQPMTYMNLSGQSVQKVMHFYKIKPESLFVVYDEIDLPAGQMRLKFDGGHAGHNGMKDIIARLNTRAFYRLRIGVGRPKFQQEVHEHVLSKPSHDEREIIHVGIAQALSVLPDVLSGKFEHAMSQLHTMSK